MKRNISYSITEATYATLKRESKRLNISASALLDMLVKLAFANKENEKC